MKNGKRPECDSLITEQLKRGSEIPNEIISEIFNEAAKTGTQSRKNHYQPFNPTNKKREKILESPHRFREINK